MEIGRVIVWWLAFVGLGMAGWPLESRIRGQSGFRGPWLALPVSLTVLLSTSFWIGQVAFDVRTIAIAIAVLLGSSLLLSRNETFNPEWRPAGEVLAVFTVAFLFMISLRAAAPGIYPGGGEKFLDMGLLQSVLRAPALPPEDMWFAGEPVVYYYGGHLVAGILAEMTATAGRYAYALALSGFYAIEVTAVYGLARSLAADRGLPPRRAGAASAFLGGFGSNLLTPVRLMALAAPPGVRSAIDTWVARGSTGVFDIRAGGFAITPETFFYWDASRVIPHTVNEFPLFSYRNGDLHAHMMGIAFTLLVVGVLYAYYGTARENVRRRWALLLGVLPPAIGAVTLVNTWSVPTAWGLTALTIAGAPAPPRSLFGRRVSKWLAPADSRRGAVRTEIQRPVGGLIVASLVVGAGVLWVAPFVVDTLLAGAGNRSVAFLPERSPLIPFLLVHGGFLGLFGAWIGGVLASERRAVLGTLTLVPIAVLLGWVTNAVAILLAGPFVVVGWYLVRRKGLGFEGILLVGGAGLVVLVEYVYLADNAATQRFNTVFKTYMQVWTLWATAAGVAVAALTARTDRIAWPTASTRHRLGQIAVALLLVSTSLYGAMAVPTMYGNADGYTLDGFADARSDHPEEAAAIEWFAAKSGRPTIAAAPGTDAYSWQNPVSSLTGIPTVAGWVHERIYRGGDVYHRRVEDVELLFSTADPATRAAMIRRYDVEYLYYGPRERERYGRHAYAEEPGIEVAYRSPNGDVIVYRIDRDDLIEYGQARSTRGRSYRVWVGRIGPGSV
ncbi:MAG: DUF2298 domain-containing protein [Halanaeroarchaeum sp.]